MSANLGPPRLPLGRNPKPPSLRGLAARIWTGLGLPAGVATEFAMNTELSNGRRAAMKIMGGLSARGKGEELH
jgi:hypothetical protein